MWRLVAISIRRPILVQRDNSGASTQRILGHIALMLGYITSRLLTLRLPMTCGKSDPLDFHFCRIFTGDEIHLALTRHQHYLCSMLGLRPGMTVLNIGSGIGDIALELVRYANVTVVGVDSDDAKVQYATNRIREAGLSHKISFIHATLEELTAQLSGKSFNVIYAMESLKNAPSFEAIYHDLVQLLRPGGKLGVVDWCWTTSFDPADPDHCRLAELIEASSHLSHRAPHERSARAACTALKAAGLSITHCEDLSTREDKIPWYTPLEKAIADPNTPWWSDSDDLCPPFGGMSKDAASVIVHAAKWKLFTPLAVFVAQRPA